MAAILSRPQCVKPLMQTWKWSRLLQYIPHIIYIVHTVCSGFVDFINICQGYFTDAGAMIQWSNPTSLQWRHNGHDGFSNHQPHNCLINPLFRHRSEETSKLQVTGFCEGNSPVTSEFPAQRASNAENVSIWWRHHVRVWYSSPQ